MPRDSSVSNDRLLTLHASMQRRGDRVVTKWDLDNLGYASFGLNPYELGDLNETIDSLRVSATMAGDIPMDFERYMRITGLVNSATQANLPLDEFETQTIANYMLVRSIANKDIRGVIEALRMGANPDDQCLLHGRRYTPIVLAAQLGSIDIVRTLLDAGGNVNRATLHGESAVAMAANYDNYDLARYLLEHGGDPNIVAQEGLTSLAVAESAKMIRLLLKHGADPNIPDIDGDLPIVARIDNGDRESVQALIDGGTDLSHTNKAGFTMRQLLERAGMPTTKSAPTQNHATNGNASSASSSSGGCYVATAVYGSYDCPEVWVLRRFRDQCLSRTVCGRLFIQAYYAISPKLVSRFGRSAWFTKPSKWVLDGFVKCLKTKGIRDDAYSDAQ